MEFLQVDVFAEAAYRGNPLAVFPDAGDLTGDQMQAIATEMNLSETAFVTGVDNDGYSVRIFTPRSELPFAGHPTIGTCWVLRHLGVIDRTRLKQRSGAGVTRLEIDGDLIWLSRDEFEVGPDVALTETTFEKRLAASLGVEEGAIGMEARELGRPGRLRPAWADAGLRNLVVPLRDVTTLERLAPRSQEVVEISPIGLYCFSAYRAGGVRARGFYPGLGIVEDPATGSAAAALGAYLCDRLGDIDFEIEQGAEIDRPSHIKVKAKSDSVSVGGRVQLIFKSSLEALP